MAPKQVGYYFGRLNLWPIRSSAEKLMWLKEIFSSTTGIRYRKLAWQIFRVTESVSELGEFLSGYLGRYRERATVEVAAPETRDVNLKRIENLVIARAPFFLHVKSGIIAYHPVPGQISAKVFKARFRDLVIRKAGSFFVSAEIDDIEEESSVLQALDRFDRVTEIRVVLRPSNPSNREIWKRVDDRLRELGATQYTEHIKTEDPTVGLRVAKDPDMISKISMAEDGYGKAVAKGEINGQPHTVSTSRNPMIVPGPNDPEQPERVLRDIEPRFVLILKRFKE